MLASVHAAAAVSITNVMGRRQLKLCSKKTSATNSVQETS